MVARLLHTDYAFLARERISKAIQVKNNRITTNLFQHFPQLRWAYLVVHLGHLVDALLPHSSKALLLSHFHCNPGRRPLEQKTAQKFLWIIPGNKSCQKGKLRTPDLTSTCCCCATEKLVNSVNSPSFLLFRSDFPCQPPCQSEGTTMSSAALQPNYMKVFVQRDYSDGTSVKFQTRFPPELENRVSLVALPWHADILIHSLLSPSSSTDRPLRRRSTNWTNTL